MEFAIVMTVLVVTAVVWLVLATRADRRVKKHIHPWQRPGWVGPGAYTTGTFGGHVDPGGSSSCDSGGAASKQCPSAAHSQSLSCPCSSLPSARKPLPTSIWTTARSRSDSDGRGGAMALLFWVAGKESVHPDGTSDGSSADSDLGAAVLSSDGGGGGGSD
ncbi:hypothetical protein B0G38_002956 [Arthrobacter sp. VKM Ac-2550]|nr:hypothetical protein [Arthrobacter sp. VKM Ac-2550]